MIRLTQTEPVHDKKERDSSSPDDSTAAIKKEADGEAVTSQRNEQPSSGNSADLFSQFLALNIMIENGHHYVPSVIIFHRIEQILHLTFS